QRLYFAGHRVRQEVVHAVEGQIDVELTFAGQGVIHLERHARLQRLHAFVEVVDVDFQELTLVDGWQIFHRLANQIGHNAHHKRQLKFAFCAVDLYVVLDLHAGSTVACDEFLSTVTHCHDVLHQRCAVKVKRQTPCLSS